MEANHKIMNKNNCTLKKKQNNRKSNNGFLLFLFLFLKTLDQNKTRKSQFSMDNLLVDIWE